MKAILILLLVSLSCMLSNENKAIFIKNEGQMNSEVLYYSQFKGLNLFLKNDGFYYDFYQEIDKDENKVIKKGHIVKLDFLNSNMTNINSNKLEAKYNFIKGKDESLWIKNVPTTNEININNIYSNIDLKMYFDDSKPRYDLILKPNANPEDIKFNFKSAYNTEVENEQLKSYINIGDFYTNSLYAYQEINGVQKQIDCKFKKLKDGSITFDVGNYDKSKELIIDPIVYSSLLGWNGDDYVSSIETIDNNTYLVSGVTTSPDFPITEGAYQEEFGLGKDVFIMKYSKIGVEHKLLVATFYGGTDDDIVKKLIYNNQKIYIGGITLSEDLPMKNSLDNSYGGNQDGFICVFNNDMNDIEYSYYVGEGEEDAVNDIAVMNNKAFFGGYSKSTNLKLVQPYQTEHKGFSDCILGASRSNGSSFEFFTYLGTTQEETIEGIDIDAQENIYWIGSTNSNNFPTKPSGGWGNRNTPYDKDLNGGWDMIVGRFTAGAGILQLSTYFGGTSDDFGVDVFAASNKSYYFVGYSMKEQEETIQTSDGLIQKSNAGGHDIIFGKLSDVISRKWGLSNFFETQDLEYSTFIGGRDNDIPLNLARSSDGQSFLISGVTNSGNFPQINDDVKKLKLSGSHDGFVCEINSFASAISYSTYIGGGDYDAVNGAAYFPNGNFIFGGETTSNDFTSKGFKVNTELNNQDGFVASSNNGSFLLSSPLGGDAFCVKTPITTVWSQNNFDEGDGFNIYLVNDNFDTKELIAEKVKGTFNSWIIPEDAVADSNYRILIEHNSGFFDISPNTFIINQFPKISEFTTSNTKFCVGENLLLSAKTNDVYYPKFNWKFNGQNIETTTSSTFNVSELSVESSGEYNVTVIGECNPNVDSKKIEIDVAPITKIISTLNEELKIDKGSELSITIEAEGGDLTYQWYLNDGVLTGQKNSTLTINNVTKADEGKYTCKVIGRCGEDVVSDPIDVVIQEPGSVRNSDLIDEFYFDGESIHTEFKVDYSGLSTIRIIDLQGKEMYFNEIYLNKGTNKITTPINLETGTYLYSTIVNNKVVTNKFSVVN